METPASETVCASASVMSFPSMVILPLWGVNRPMTVFMVVDFPAPFLPRKATASPSPTLRLKS